MWLSSLAETKQRSSYLVAALASKDNRMIIPLCSMLRWPPSTRSLFLHIQLALPWPPFKPRAPVAACRSCPSKVEILVFFWFVSSLAVKKKKRFPGESRDDPNGGYYQLYLLKGVGKAATFNGVAILITDDQTFWPGGFVWAWSSSVSKHFKRRYQPLVYLKLACKQA